MDHDGHLRIVVEHTATGLVVRVTGPLDAAEHSHTRAGVGGRPP